MVKIKNIINIFFNSLIKLVKKPQHIYFNYSVLPDPWWFASFNLYNALHLYV